MIEMIVESVRINQATQQRVVILKEIVQERYLFIWIAHAEAYAIAVELQGTPSPRPLMHDLFKNTMNALGVKIVRMVISKLVEEVFHSYIVFETANNRVEVDARPADAISIVMRARAPIYVEENILKLAGVTLGENSSGDGNSSDPGNLPHYAG